jgi:hypothetical protein
MEIATGYDQRSLAAIRWWNDRQRNSFRIDRCDYHSVGGMRSSLSVWI